MKQEVLLQAPVRKLYLSYLIPTLIAMLSNSLYCLVDVYFISKGSGSIGLAALNIAMPIFTLYSAIGLCLGVGGATIMSIALGNRQHTLRNQAFSLSVFLMLIIGLLISVLSVIFVEPFAYLLGSSEALLPYVKEYMLPINVTSFAFILMYATSILLRADHAPGLAMKAMLVGNISNMILDYVFVMEFDMGLFGASVATAISPCLTLLIASWHFIGKKNTVQFTRHCMSPALLKRMISNGLGSGIMEISAGSIILVFNMVILAVGDESFLASFAIVTNIAYVCKGLLNGFAQGAQPILSANYGANQNKRVKQTLHCSLLFACGFALFLYIFFLLFPQSVASLFANGDQALLQQSAIGIRLYFSSLVFTAAITMIMYYFQSIESGKVATVLAIAKGFVFVIIGLLTMMSLFGINGIWLAVTFAEVMTLLIAVLYMKKRT